MFNKFAPLKQKAFFKFRKCGLFNNNNDLGGLLLSQKHNNLRVVSTPEFPVPYYQRIIRNPPATEAVTISLDTFLEPPTDNTVVRVKHDLAQTAEGLQIIDYVENHLKVKSYVTYVSSIAEQCNIYADDLIHYLDSAHEENVRILKNVDLADCLK
jgi:hypothetical protein